MEVTKISKSTRWIIVFAGVLVQLCLGTAYIWGVFQTELVDKFGFDNKAAALTFSLLLGTLTFGSMIGGKIQDKFGPKPVLLGGGIVMALGFVLASLGTSSAPYVMWLTYGVLGGLGMGASYTTVIAVCQKWFPDKRGIISGLIVAALGAGGLVFTPLATTLIANKSVGVMQTFIWFGAIFVVVGVIAALIMKNPPADYKPEGWVTPQATEKSIPVQQFKPLEVLKTPQYYMIALAFMTACAAGFMVIPFAKVLAKQGGISPGTTALAVMIISVFNSLGRLVWGYISDKIGRKNTLITLMLIVGVTILFVSAAQQYVMLTLIGVIAFSFGGLLGVFPSLTADYFGTKNMGVNYGLVMFGFSTGAVVFSAIAGYFKDLNQGFSTSFIIASIAAFFGAVIIFFLKPPKRKEE
ncbi:MAG: OFA family MFS transporter [Bacillota bacterium]